MAERLHIEDNDMKKYIIAPLILLLAVPAFGAQTVSRHLEPEIPVLNAMAYGLGGTVIDGWYANQIVRVMKEQGVYASAKFVGAASIAVIKDGSNATSNCIDYSGNANHTVQPTGANQPIWTANQQNGRAGLVFDGSNDRLTSGDLNSGITNVSGCSLFQVLKPIDLSSVINSPIPLSVREASTATGKVRGLFITATTNYIGFVAFTPDTISTTSITTNTTLLEGYLATDKRTVTVYKNAAPVAISAFGSDAASPNNPTHFNVGGTESGAYFANASIMFSLISNVQFTTAQRQAMEAVLNAYYAIY